MKDLNVYIEELLYKHQCVIIPKFGAFISNRKSAKMADDKTFDPPKRELSFNASLNSNDGLLMKYVSEQSGIDYKLVEDYVNLAVEGWKRILQQEQPLVLDRIGTLRQTREGRVSFEPANEVNYLTDSFGMGPFVPHEVPTADLQIAENQIKPTIDPESILPPEEKSLAAIESPISQPAPPVEPISQPEVENIVPPKPTVNKKKFKLRPYIKYTAVAMLGLAILAYGAYALFSEKLANGSSDEQQYVVTDSLVQERLNQQLSEAAVFTPPITMPVINLTPEKGKAKPESKPKTVTESPKPTRTEPTPTSKPTQTTAGTKPTQTTTGTKPTQTTAGTKPANTNTPSASNRPSPLANKKYQVIAGAFSSEKNAQARVQQLRKIGYPNAFVLGVNAKGLYQVSYGGFDSVDEARLQQREVQASKQEKKLDGGWILTQP
ncbi:SPOR domain-containing protein [Capnocytophaga genosp. AHN8471]|uniref:HU domain-containing protein n=1 Tax=Capnocytophaga genosp. AHN8471 TaxID=327574 RepID=UPI0019318A90|nr:SPOR domain-containing protein [Capnocytophaga genosp. AHN8471]MBM0657159.1 SPOR domain-containing protein [Capnocytophaga genosp. AHN8471]